ncbi:MAG: hypothetical protein QXP80_03640 [Zestosphaera sp.]
MPRMDRGDSNAVIKCLERREVPLTNDVMVTLYKVVKDLDARMPDVKVIDIHQLRTADLIKHSGLRRVCRDSDAATLSKNGLSIFITLRKPSVASLQLLNKPSVVREICVLREISSSSEHKSGGDPQVERTEDIESFGVRLALERIQLGEELIAYDSSLKGELSTDVVALKIVGQEFERVISRDELIAYLDKVRDLASLTSSRRTSREGRKRLKSVRARRNRRRKKKRSRSRR